MSKSILNAQETFSEALTARYGLLMTTDEVRAALKYRTGSALSMAQRAGYVRLKACEVPGRRGYIYRTADVAAELARWADGASCPKEGAM